MAKTNLLIVDDDEDTRNLLKEYFEGLGYTVATTEGDHDALQKLDTLDAECVISNLVTPQGMDGLELLKKMRAGNRNTMFLINTGHPSIDTAVKVMKVGAYDCICKPYHLEDVRIKVERALYTKKLEKSAKTITGIVWAIIISIPIWLFLGILGGKAWK
jgi:DNA-binding NtrC family response regulator